MDHDRPLTSGEDEELAFYRAQLAEAEKMATIGQMTTSIAHEIKNLIGFFTASLGPLRMDFEELRTVLESLQSLKNSKNPREDLDRLLALGESLDTPYLIQEIGTLLDGLDEGTRRAQDIVSGLKYYSRSDEPDFIPADLHRELDTTLLLLKHRMANHIRVHKNYGSLPAVECIPGKLSQVFMNLLSNAIQSIEEKGDGEGELFIQTEYLKGDRVRIALHDTGTGMTEAVRAHIFEPFYTTKNREKGNGLGLAISLSIIQLHRGFIEVKSQLGMGSTFEITLPVRQPNQITGTESEETKG